MNTPKIRGPGIVQDGSPTRWTATGDGESVGWREVWAKNVVDALEALQARAAKMARARGTQEDDS